MAQKKKVIKKKEPVKAQVKKQEQPTDITNPLFKGMYSLFMFGALYNLSDDLFTVEIKAGVKALTGLEYGGSMDDWWVFPDTKEMNFGNPVFSWPDLIKLSLSILNCRLTSLVCKNLHLETMLKGITFKEVSELPHTGVSGAKRVNACAGDYTDYHYGLTSMQSFAAQLRGAEPAPKKITLPNNMFRLHGKDRSCVVEGTWLHWVCFACNVLASENTKLVCPEVYEPALRNNNY